MTIWWQIRLLDKFLITQPHVQVRFTVDALFHRPAHFLQVLQRSTITTARALLTDIVDDCRAELKLLVKDRSSSSEFFLPFSN